MNAVLYSQSVVKRFWQYVDKRGPDDCWLWKASLTVRGGYGQLMDCRNGKRVLLKAHRISLEIHKGKIPDGLNSCHSCNNPPCCNPAHLYAGTTLDNWKDSVKAGTQVLPTNAPKGETHHDAKLRELDVIYILQSNESGVELAEKFGVTRGAISLIRRGRTWKNLSLK